MAGLAAQGNELKVTRHRRCTMRYGHYSSLSRWRPFSLAGSAARQTLWRSDARPLTKMRQMASHVWNNPVETALLVVPRPGETKLPFWRNWMGDQAVSRLIIEETHALKIGATQMDKLL